MPSPDTRDRKQLLPHHLFNQGARLDGAGPRKVFVDDEDRRFFLTLLARHLGMKPATGERGRVFQHLRPLIALHAYCLMTTHFHLVVWQRDPQGIALLMNRVNAVYTRYFNEKYGSERALFRGPPKAKPIDTPDYFRWVIGYVHDNHHSGVDYEFSSHRAWVDENHRPGWLSVEPAMKQFGGEDGYLQFLNDRRQKQTLDRQLGFGKARTQEARPKSAVGLP